jgi:hypothetical protein
MHILFPSLNETSLCWSQEKYYEEYRLYELGDLASRLVGPLLKDQLNNWLPLENPQEPMALFKQWKDILEDGHPQTLTNISTQDPYHRLVWQAWMPSVRTAIKYVTQYLRCKLLVINTPGQFCVCVCIRCLLFCLYSCHTYVGLQHIENIHIPLSVEGY